MNVHRMGATITEHMPAAGKHCIETDALVAGHMPGPPYADYPDALLAIPLCSAMAPSAPHGSASAARLARFLSPTAPRCFIPSYLTFALPQQPAGPAAACTVSRQGRHHGPLISQRGRIMALRCALISGRGGQRRKSEHTHVGQAMQLPKAEISAGPRPIGRSHCDGRVTSHIC